MKVSLHTHNYLTRKTQPTFKSYEHREMAQQRLQEQYELERKLKQEEQDRLISSNKASEELLQKTKNYSSLEDISCKKMASLILSFSCSVLNESEHSPAEFFGSDEEAKKLRSKLSEKCQETSITLREEIQKLKAFEDPITTLITANRLKDFAPKKGILKDEQFEKIVDASKSSCLSLIANADFSNFEENDINSINELTQIIKNTDGLDFGYKYREKLDNLIKNLNNAPQKNNNQTKVYIPEVVVLHR